jgi:hypothetical protein
MDNDDLKDPVELDGEMPAEVDLDGLDDEEVLADLEDDMPMDLLPEEEEGF